MIRTLLSDAQWDRIKGLVPGKESDRGVTGRNNRLFVEAVLWASLFKALADDPDFEYVMLDSTIVRAHQYSAGAKGGLRIRPSGARAGA